MPNTARAKGFMRTFTEKPAPGDFFQRHGPRLRRSRRADRHPCAIRNLPRRNPSWRWCSARREAFSAYTLANDVSAWDIERENPLYLPQSKTYTACCALGPVIVTVDEIADARALEMTCTVRRGGRRDLFRCNPHLAPGKDFRDAGRVFIALESGSGRVGGFNRHRHHRERRRRPRRGRYRDHKNPRNRRIVESLRDRVIASYGRGSDSAVG